MRCVQLLIANASNATHNVLVSVSSSGCISILTARCTHLRSAFVRQRLCVSVCASALCASVSVFFVVSAFVFARTSFLRRAHARGYCSLVHAPFGVQPSDWLGCCVRTIRFPRRHPPAFSRAKRRNRESRNNRASGSRKRAQHARRSAATGGWRCYDSVFCGGFGCHKSRWITLDTRRIHERRQQPWHCVVVVVVACVACQSTMPSHARRARVRIRTCHIGARPFWLYTQRINSDPHSSRTG